jgi:hypothetical protein
MRLLLMACLAFCGLVGLASAQESANSTVVESVISAAPEADGKAYLLSVMLKDGRQLSLRVQAADAVKIVDGLSKTAGPGSQKAQIVALVQSMSVQADAQMSVQADAQGRFVLLQPRTNEGPTEPLAIPIQGADRFLQLFQQKAAETKANAAKPH